MKWFLTIQRYKRIYNIAILLLILWTLQQGYYQLKDITSHRKALNSSMDENNKTAQNPQKAGNNFIRQHNREVCSNQVRQKHVSDICEGHSWYRPDHPGQVIRQLTVVDEYKLLYCSIPKCGSTTMRSLICNITNTEPDRFSDHIAKNGYWRKTKFRLFDTLSKDEQQVVLEDYYKVVVVRHPLDRLRAAHVDVILGKQLYKKPISRYLGTQNSSENKDKSNDNKLSMEQFYDMLRRNQSDFQDHHWASFWYLCNPCSIKYDLIMKLETIDDEIGQLYDYIKSINSSVSLSDLDHGRQRYPDVHADKMRLVSDMVREFDPEMMHDLTNMYRQDFMWAGYDWDREHGATCMEGNQGCC